LCVLVLVGASCIEFDGLGGGKKINEIGYNEDGTEDRDADIVTVTWGK